MTLAGVAQQLPFASIDSLLANRAGHIDETGNSFSAARVLPIGGHRVTVPCIYRYRSESAAAENGGRKAEAVRTLVPHRRTRSGIFFQPPSKPSSYLYSEGRLQAFLKGALEANFFGSVSSMAKSLGFVEREIEGYLQGGLPRKISTVHKLEKGFVLDTNLILKAWERDGLEAIDFLYPIPSKTLPLRKKLIRLVRLATMHLGGFGPVNSALSGAGFTIRVVNKEWNSVFTARLNSINHALFYKNASKIIAASGVASEAEATLLIEEARAEHPRMEIPMGDAREIQTMFADDPAASAFDAVDPVEAVFELELARRIKWALKTILPREERVIRMLFGIGGEPSHRSSEVANSLAVTKQRISQLKDSAMIKLRNPERKRHLWPYWWD